MAASGAEGGEGGGSSIWDGSHNAFVPAFHEFLGIAVVGLFALYYSRALLRWALSKRGVSRRGAKRGQRASARRFGSINDPEAPEPESGRCSVSHDRTTTIMLHLFRTICTSKAAWLQLRFAQSR